jgi:hypothetical protein
MPINPNVGGILVILNGNQKYDCANKIISMDKKNLYEIRIHPDKQFRTRFDLNGYPHVDDKYFEYFKSIKEAAEKYPFIMDKFELHKQRMLDA